MILLDVIEEHAEEAAFLWVLRSLAVKASHYSLSALSNLDERVEAHLDGLRVAGDTGWDICEAALEKGQVAELFTVAAIALQIGKESRIRRVLETASASRAMARGMVSALGWLPYSQVAAYIKEMLAADLPGLRRLGIAACAVRREDPGRHIADGIADRDPLSRMRALRAAGELGRLDLLPSLQAAMADEEDGCRFAAAWSAALLGSISAGPVLRDVAQAAGSYSERACFMMLRRMGLPDGQSWIRDLANQSERRRLAVIGAGALGDPASIPWLVEHMAVPELARVAGESFSMITGVDIAYENLEGEWPAGFEAGPTENPEDEDVALDPDEDLPWPNPELIDQWWSKNKSRFRSGTRYLLGKPISIEQCQHVLRYGYQRQRAAAAIELAMLQPGQPLFEVRAPGFRQQQMLGLKTKKA